MPRHSKYGWTAPNKHGGVGRQQQYVELGLAVGLLWLSTHSSLYYGQSPISPATYPQRKGRQVYAAYDRYSLC